MYPRRVLALALCALGVGVWGGAAAAPAAAYTSGGDAIIAFTSVPIDAPASSSGESPFTLSLLWNGVLTTLSDPESVTVTSSTSTGGFSTTADGTRRSAIVLPIDAGQSSVTGYFGDSVAESVTLTANVSFAAEQEQTETFTSGEPAAGIVVADGSGHLYGAGVHVPSLPELGVALETRIVGVAVSSDHKGAWLLGRDGGVFAVGDAPYSGSPAGLGIDFFSPPTAIVSAGADEAGYLVVASDGGVFAFGGAHYAGSVPALAGEGRSVLGPSQGIVAAATTPDGRGYWLVGADGGVFAFGEARFHGSLPQLGVTPRSPIVGVASTNDGQGYWLLGADGGVFAFGDAAYLGSPFNTGGAGGNDSGGGGGSSSTGWAVYRPALAAGGGGGGSLAALAIVSSHGGHGYWVVRSDDTVASFGDAPSVPPLTEYR